MVAIESRNLFKKKKRYYIILGFIPRMQDDFIMEKNESMYLTLLTIKEKNHNFNKWRKIYDKIQYC